MPFARAALHRRAVAFLAESDSITGQILFVDGGQHLKENRNP